MFSSVIYFEYHNSKDVRQPEEDKLKVLKEITCPCDVKGVRQFLDFVNFFAISSQTIRGMHPVCAAY